MNAHRPNITNKTQVRTIKYQINTETTIYLDKNRKLKDQLQHKRMLQDTLVNVRWKESVMYVVIMLVITRNGTFSRAK